MKCYDCEVPIEQGYECKLDGKPCCVVCLESFTARWNRLTHGAKVLEWWCDHWENQRRGTEGRLREMEWED